MPIGFVRDTEWYDGNRQRRYPFVDAASMLDTTGSVRLPDSAIVDISLTVPSKRPSLLASWLDKFHVKTVVVSGTGLIVTLGNDGNVIARFSMSAASPRYTSYPITVLEGPYKGTSGTVVMGDAAEVLAAVGAGIYEFDMQATRIIPTRVRPSLIGVSSLSIVNGNMTSDPIMGDVTLSAGSNISFEIDTVENIIKIHSIATKVAADCSCANLPAFPSAVRTINGVSPDTSGNIALLGDDCLEIATASEPYTLEFKSKCAEPCCDCGEEDIIKKDLDVLYQRATTLQSLVDSFGERLISMENVIGAVNSL